MVGGLPGESDGEIILIDKLMGGGTVFHKHIFFTCMSMTWNFVNINVLP